MISDHCRLLVSPHAYSSMPLRRLMEHLPMQLLTTASTHLIHPQVLMPHDGTPVIIRIGIHTGPCVRCELSGLDGGYYGRLRVSSTITSTVVHEVIESLHSHSYIISLLY